MIWGAPSVLVREMKTYTIGNDTMPGLGLGTWKSAPGEVREAVKEALRVGYRHIDCAAAYENESEVGEAIAASVSAGVVKREEVWITSKLWNDMHAPGDVEEACEKTLSDLRLDYLDLYLMHWPIATKKGVGFPRKASDFVSPEELPVEVTWHAMEKLVDAGKVRHIGVSNFSAEKVRALVGQAKRPVAVNQVELHPYLQQDDLLAACRSLGVHVTAYSPLGSKDRPDSLKGKDEPLLLEDPAVADVAKKHGASPAQVLIAFALARDTSVIPKSVNPKRIAENLAAADVELDADDRGKLAGLDRHRRYIDGKMWEREGGPHTVENLWDEPA